MPLIPSSGLSRPRSEAYHDDRAFNIYTNTHIIPYFPDYRSHSIHSQPPPPPLPGPCHRFDIFTSVVSHARFYVVPPLLALKLSVKGATCIRGNTVSSNTVRWTDEDVQTSYSIGIEVTTLSTDAGPPVKDCRRNQRP